MAKIGNQLLGVVSALALLTTASACQSATPTSIATVVATNSAAPSVAPSSTTVPPSHTPFATVAEATATDNPGSGLIRIQNYGMDRSSPPSILYIDPNDAAGLAKPGIEEYAQLNDWWLVQVVGQSTDGVFLKVKFIEVDHSQNYRGYVGLTGWMYAFWAGYFNPILPAQFEILKEPVELEPYRKLFLDFTLGEIGAAMVAQGTQHTDDLVLPALHATQTEWAALQTPQP